MYKNTEIVRWLWRTAKGNRLQAGLNAMIGILQVVASLTGVWAVQHAIDIASGHIKGDLYWAVGIMACIILAEFALSISAVWVKNILGVRAQNRMQRQSLDRLLRSEWNGKERFHSGDVLNRLEGDVNNVVNFITETLPSTISTLMLFIGAFLYLFMMDHTLALLTIIIIPVCLLLSKLYIRKMRRLNRSVRDSDSEIQSVLQETVQNRMLIKTLESDGIMVSRLGNSQQTLRKKVVKRTSFSLLSKLIVNFGFAGSYLLAFLWSAVRMSNGSLSFGGMTAFLQLVNRIQAPARNLSKLIPAFVSVLTAAERLMELEEIPQETQGESIHIPAPCGLRLDDVSFQYDDGEEDVIKNLSFDFRPGTATAIVGETGAGKTTLIRMVLALMHPTSGHISIYSGDNNKGFFREDAVGSNTQLSPLDSRLSTPSPSGEGWGGASPLSPLHRCNFVYVPQGNTLLSGTIRDNLLLGKPDATDEELENALRKSCADFVLELPDGLDTKCTENGGGLSEGQAQRIAIARALLRNRPIMLFDEATSALDPETERQLLHNILAGQDKTVLFITHRMAVCDYCDQILHL